MSVAMLAAADITGTVQSGPFVVAAALALAAGVVSFASPCVLPLVPGYLSYLVSLVGADGVDGADGGSRGSVDTRVRSRAVIGTLLFVLGFTVVILLQSLAVLGLGSLLLEHNDLLLRLGGVVTVLMGLAMLGYIRPLQREARVHARPKGRVTGALLLGGFFALGWTACMGPTLAGVLTLAYSTDWNGNAFRGLVLVVFYCLGLGIPFLLVAFGFGWVSGAMGFLRRNSRTIQVIGALCLIALGLLMVTGLWGDFVAGLRTQVLSTETVL